MRTRLAVPALACAIVLGGLAAAPAFADTAVKPTINKASVGSLVVGTTGTKTISVTVTASDDSGVKGVKVAPWPKLIDPPLPSDAVDFPDATCKASSKTTSVCTYTEKLNVKTDFANELAGTWYLAVQVTGKDGGTTFNAKATSFTIKRQDKLAATAGAPKPVKKKATLTLTSKLTRANWDTDTWPAYAKQGVKLQFLKSGTKTWTTVKTVTSSTTGALKTTTKPTATGSWRFVFAGNSVSSAVTSTPVAVTVK
jgi:hypothetical protein